MAIRDLHALSAQQSLDTKGRCRRCGQGSYPHRPSPIRPQLSGRAASTIGKSPAKNQQRPKSGPLRPTRLLQRSLCTKLFFLCGSNTENPLFLPKSSSPKIQPNSQNGKCPSMHRANHPIRAGHRFTACMQWLQARSLKLGNSNPHGALSFSSIPYGQARDSRSKPCANKADALVPFAMLPDSWGLLLCDSAPCFCANQPLRSIISANITGKNYVAHPASPAPPAR